MHIVDRNKNIHKKFLYHFYIVGNNEYIDYGDCIHLFQIKSRRIIISNIKSKTILKKIFEFIPTYMFTGNNIFMPITIQMDINDYIFRKTK